MNAISHRPVQAVLVPQNFDQLCRFAEMAAGSDLMPRDYKGKPANIMLAVQMGSELGLAPMQALQSIAVINGRPGVWGDGMIGLCRQSSLCEDIREWIEGEGDARTAHCEAKRKGASPTLGRFSVADAKKAGLWSKQGPWTQYPDRMLQNRARGFALRDAFPDLLRGLKTVEELRDIPDERPEPKSVQSTVVQPEPKRAAAPAPSAFPTRAEMDQTLNGDEIPDWDAPKPDRLRKVADRIKERLTEAADGDAYNKIMSHEGIQAEWEKIKRERPELAEELEAHRAAELDRIAVEPAGQPA